MGEVLHIQDVHDDAIGKLCALDIAHARPKLLVYGSIGLLAEKLDDLLVAVKPAQAQDVVYQTTTIVEALPEGLIV
jgi:hypothetical protein